MFNLTIWARPPGGYGRGLPVHVSHKYDSARSALKAASVFVSAERAGLQFEPDLYTVQVKKGE